MLDNLVGKRLFVRLYHSGIEFEMTGILRQNELDKRYFSMEVEKPTKFASRCGFELASVKCIDLDSYAIPCITLW